jgi:hypothetical protein
MLVFENPCKVNNNDLIKYQLEITDLNTNDLLKNAYKASDLRLFFSGLPSKSFQKSGKFTADVMTLFASRNSPL